MTKVKKFGERDLFVASKIDSEIDERTGYERTIHSKPQHYAFSYMPASSQTDYQLYGTIGEDIYVSYVERKVYEGVFHIGDRAYLQNGERTLKQINSMVKTDNFDKYCTNANYRIKSVLPQNLRIKIIFEKIA
nr:MAG TPA: hypothetical protein [Caudoviricetes sp.]